MPDTYGAQGLENVCEVGGTLSSAPIEEGSRHWKRTQASKLQMSLFDRVKEGEMD